MYDNVKFTCYRFITQRVSKKIVYLNVIMDRLLLLRYVLKFLFTYLLT